jgi:hypothetical protein
MSFWRSWGRKKKDWFFQFLHKDLMNNDDDDDDSSKSIAKVFFLTTVFFTKSSSPIFSTSIQH